MKQARSPQGPFFWKYWTGLATFIFLIRLLLAGSEELVPINNAWQKSRIRQVIEAIRSGRIARLSPNDKLILMLGASEPLLAFQPLAFDRLNRARGWRSTSYNLSLQNVGSVMPLYLARIESELAKRSIRADLIIVGLPLPRFTERSRSSFYSRSKYHDVDAALFEPWLWREHGATLEDTLVLLFNKWALGERSLVQLQRTASQLSRETLAAFLGKRTRPALFYDKRLHPEPAWSPPSRGGFFFNIESEGEVLSELFRRAGAREALLADRADLVSCCDLLDMNFDEEYLRNVTKAIVRLHGVAEQVLLVAFPERPGLERSEIATNRIRRVLGELAAASGATLFSPVTRASFDPADFFDQSHFTPRGVDKFNRVLADELAGRAI